MPRPSDPRPVAVTITAMALLTTLIDDVGLRPLLPLLYLLAVVGFAASSAD